ncbi:MAG: Phosphatidylglycerol/phosphatidylinositol transfer protein [Claussenomyces sp. TS43310]|nr:MAG: Phosphatidylglycerol/phosphatidylinositol transfer protein [Claussenomyces sp. TS43310]
MKFLGCVATLFFMGSHVAAGSLSFFGTGQSTLADDDLSIPGDNPLEYCQAEHATDILLIDHVDLSPNPPLAGKTLTIEAVGTLLEDVQEDAYVVLQVKYGLIRLVNTQADLCEQVSNVELECPIKKGDIKLTKDVELPSEIPPGKYTVFADVYNYDKKHITCLTATVTFAPQ